MTGPHWCLGYICTTGHMRFLKQNSPPRLSCLGAETAKLTQLTAIYFLLLKIQGQNNPGSNKDLGRAPLYIFHVPGKYSQSLIILMFPATLITTSETGGEEPCLHIYKEETKDFSALHFFLVLHRFCIIDWL